MRLYLSVGLGTPWNRPGGAGGSGCASFLKLRPRAPGQFCIFKYKTSTSSCGQNTTFFILNCKGSINGEKSPCRSPKTPDSEHPLLDHVHPPADGPAVTHASDGAPELLCVQLRLPDGQVHKFTPSSVSPRLHAPYMTTEAS